MKEYEATSASDIPRKKEERKIIRGVPRFIIRVELRCACATKKHASFDIIRSYGFVRTKIARYFINFLLSNRSDIYQG